MALQEKDLHYLIQKEKHAKVIFAELNKNMDLNKTLSIIIKRIKEFINIESIAIRLLDNSDYPYFVYSGFSRSFIKRENSLIATDKNGNRLLSLNETNKKGYQLECMCGNIISGKFDYFKKINDLYG